jgi:30S ribosomal protein S31
MGKGDQRSRRGKIWRGTFGKRRPKRSKRVAPVTASADEKKPAKKEAAAE